MACCVLVPLPSAASATTAGNGYHGHHPPLPPSMHSKEAAAAATLLLAPPTSPPHREHRDGHEGHEGHKGRSEGKQEERTGHGGTEGQAIGDGVDDVGADGSDVMQDPEEWSLLQELSAESTQPAFDGLTILLILVAFAGAFLYFMWLERGQAPPMGVGRAKQNQKRLGVHARLPTS